MFLGVTEHGEIAVIVRTNTTAFCQWMKYKSSGLRFCFTDFPLYTACLAKIDRRISLAEMDPHPWPNVSSGSPLCQTLEARQEFDFWGSYIENSISSRTKKILSRIANMANSDTNPNASVAYLSAHILFAYQTAPQGTYVKPTYDTHR